MVDVAFVGFWRGFNPDDALLPFISSFTELDNLKVGKSRDADIYVFNGGLKSLRSLSIHAIRRPQDRQFSIWYTGENVRPPINRWNMTLSFDVDSYSNTNVYFPLALTTVQWFGQPQTVSGDVNRLGSPVRKEDVLTTRDSGILDRQKSVCAFVGNPEPTRLRAIEQLSKTGQIDVFGSHVGRPVASKLEVARDYRFMLCFENDAYPGYVTEKPVEAYVSGCIPLWRGIDTAGLLNQHALVNALDFASLEDFSLYVRACEQSPQEMMRLTTQPLLTSDQLMNRAVQASQAIWQAWKRHR